MAVRTTCQPPFSGPKRFSAGTRTFSRKRSFSSASPLAMGMGRTESPGLSIGTSRQLRPLCRSSGAPVRTRSAQCVANCAQLIQRLRPLTTNPSPTRSARVATFVRSEPASGSDQPWHQISAPSRIAGRCVRFCASLPQRARQGATTSTPTQLAIGGASAAAISS